jgi:hypothetical protein
MSWLSVGDWADELSEKIHQQRLRVAASHFGVDLGDILGNDQKERKLIARYEETGLPWPPTPEDEELE